MSNQPSCFGKHWNPNSVECRGGLDVHFRHPGNGTSIRDTCGSYNACQAETARPKVTPLVPATSLVRPTGVQPPSIPATQPSSYRPYISSPPVPPATPTYLQPQYSVQQAPPGYQQPAQPQQQVQAAAPHPQQQVVYSHNIPYTQPMYAASPVMVPMNQPMAGAAAPSFLSIPEPVNSEVSYGRRLFHTMVRSVLKAAGMSFANHFDYNPMGP